MIDMREYKGVIREAVRRERNADENWTWKVRAISKEKATIGWGYLDMIEGPGKGNFIVYAEEDENIGVIVSGIVPNGHRVIRFVGDKIWSDYKTIEEAVAGVIHRMAQYAKSVY